MIIDGSFFCSPIEIESGSRVKIHPGKLLSVLPLSGREFDIKELVWTGRLAELELFPASHPAQPSSGDAQATSNLFYGNEFLRTQ